MSGVLEMDEPAVPMVGRRRSVRMNAGRWLILAALGMWLVSLHTLRSAVLSQFGLLFTASPLFLGSMLAVAAAFLVSIRSRLFAEASVALVLASLFERLPTTLATDVPLYSWTYKHLGVVDYIQQTGQLAHGLDVYQGWPGLFAMTAWFSDITGVDPLTIAHWFTPVMHLALIGLTYALARVWKLGPYPALVAAFLVEVLNWVAQDYYSPQAIGLLLAVGFLIVVGLSLRMAVATPLALIIFAALVITHQLTPYWLMIACLALVLFRRLQPRWLIVAMVALAGAYLAFNYDVASHFSLLSFNPVQNAQSNVPTVGVFGQRVTSLVVRALSVLMWVSAVVCMWFQRRRGEAVLAPGVLALSAFVLLGGQGYGGEAIFRVFLYSLPGCALLIAPVVTRVLSAKLPWAVLMSVVVIGCVAASAQGFYGGWFANRMSRAQVDEAHNLLATAAYPAYLTVAAPVWPERSTGRYVPYAEWTLPGDPTYDYPMIYSAKLTGTDFSTAAEYSQFIKTAGSRTAPTYLIITRQMAIYDWYFGILPVNSLDNLQTRLRADPRWTVYKDTDEFVIFKSTPALIGAVR